MDSPVTELLTKLHQERTDFLAEATKLTEAEAEGPPAKGEWSVKQQLAHMYAVEHMYRYWLQRCLQEDYPELDAVPGMDIRYQAEQAHHQTLARWLELLGEERQKTIDLLPSIPGDRWQRQGHSALFGDMSVLQIVRAFYRHDRMHTEQVAGRPSSFAPRTVDGQRL